MFAPMVLAGIAFIFWTLISHLDTGDSSSVIITGFSVGMTIYLPLSLGLPFILANYFRESDENMDSRRHFVLSTILLLGACCLLGGLILAVWNKSLFSSYSTALLLAGCVILGNTVQQLGRIRDNLSLFLLGIGCTTVLPASWLISLLGGERVHDFSGVIVGLSLLIYGFVLFLSIRTFLPPNWFLDYRLNLDFKIIRASLPMIPHLLFFALLMQGVRMSTSWAGSAEDITTGHLIMLVVNAGALVVTSVHGVLCVKMMTLKESRFSKNVLSYALKYSGLGLFAALFVFVVLVSPIRLFISGLPEFTLAIIGFITIIPPSLAGYYCLTTMLLRYNKTKTLVAISFLTVALWLLSFLLLPSHELQTLLIQYCLICPLLFIFSFCAVIISGIHPSSKVMSLFAVLLIGYLPSIILILVCLMV